MGYGITLFDIGLGGMYIILIYLFAFWYKQKKIADNPEYKYFILGLTAKLIGMFAFVLLTIYHYHGGDTYVFYGAAKGLTNLLLTSPIQALEIYFMSADQFIPSHYSFANGLEFMLTSSDVFSIVKTTSLVNLLGFNSYWLTSILFAFISYFGVWFAYSNICKLYKNSTRILTIGFFLIPTVMFWSSGILKDTVTQSAIGWIVYAVSNIFIFKRKTTVSILLILLSTFFLAQLKPYLIFTLYPCLLIWVQASISNSISNPTLRFAIKPFLVIILGLSGYLMISTTSESAGKYNLENVEKTLTGFQSWHTYLAENKDQSGYTLGHVEFTPLGMLTKSPEAFNVTFFRPYLWEVRNIPTLMGGGESFLLLLIVIYLLFKLRFRFFKIIIRNKEIFFMLLFATIFGIVVGISSYNFGALSRYKMPAQWFFVVAITLIYQLATGKEEKKNSL